MKKKFNSFVFNSEFTLHLKYKHETCVQHETSSLEVLNKTQIVQFRHSQVVPLFACCVFMNALCLS